MENEVDAERIREALPEALRPLLATLAQRAARKGVALHLVGGPVRDLLLGRALRDVDLLVDAADAAKLEPLLRAAARDGVELARHDRFGTYTVRGPGFAFDVATSRRERYAHPGALPDVEPAPLDEDLARRDFAANALALRLPAPAETGAV
ncbi:MAG: hypothetical protein KC560_01160, partial [Myxococcales bacterium]|nr:hypothetical protein [Myxococcales bacterium]